MKTLFWFPLGATFSVADCYRILLVFHVNAPSHFILGSALAKGLSDAGHDVTLVSPFEEKDLPRNGSYRNVVIQKIQIQGNSKAIDLGSMNAFVFIYFMNLVGHFMAKSLFEDLAFQKLLHSGEKFDVVIAEQAMSDEVKAIAWHFDAPLIMFSTFGSNVFVNYAVGNPAPPSYIPNLLVSARSKMNLWERTQNSLYLGFYHVMREMLVLPESERLLRQFFPGSPDIRSLASNVSIYLLNSHESVNQAVPHVPCMIDIGGFHVDPPKRLPKDLQEFLDGSKNGVIYFSMGSNIKPSEMKDETKQAILNALGGLKEEILWKWDEDDLAGKPSNVKLGKWFPQQDILAHPNVKLFITHGGLLSTTETIYHGVPILALPVFGDQESNAEIAVEAGYAISLRFSDLTEEAFSKALNDLLGSTKYRENVRRRSRLMHDRPVKPLDLAIYWTEFVARHRGAPHLRVAALDLPWYQYFLVDVAFVILLITLTMIIISYLLVSRICCKARSNRKLKTN